MSKWGVIALTKQEISGRRNEMYVGALGSAALATMVWEATAGLSGAKADTEQTPADEIICIAQVEAPRGLCKAYCEVMNCDYFSTQVSFQVCRKVHDRYRIVTPSPPPCIADCPCGKKFSSFGKVIDVGRGFRSLCGRRFPID
jgi:hypothetical protein